MVWKHALKRLLGHREKDAGDGADRQEEWEGQRQGLYLW